jgi:hypothetical protein
VREVFVGKKLLIANRVSQVLYTTTPVDVVPENSNRVTPVETVPERFNEPVLV